MNLVRMNDMKILCVADEPSRMLYDFYQPGILKEYDLIIACGDLPREYLEFLVTMARCPLIYIAGNHDEAYVKNPPEGCICIDDDLFVYKGIRFLGLGGSYKYRNDATYMYTETQMKLRIFKLWPKIIRNKGFDVLVSHAPMYEFGDKHISHRGFQCFKGLIDKYQPKYMIHGHIHRNYGFKIPQVYQYENTTVINAFEYYKLDYDNSKG